MRLTTSLFRWGKVVWLCCVQIPHWWSYYAVRATNNLLKSCCSYWFDNLGFFLRENLLLNCIIPSSWGLPTSVWFTPSITFPSCSCGSIPYFHIERCYSDPLLLGVINRLPPSNGWSNRSGESKPIYPPLCVDQAKSQELGRMHPSCRVRLQSSTTPSNKENSLRDRLWFKPLHHARHATTSTPWTS